MRATTFVPEWLPLRWRILPTCYAIAICGILIATAVTRALTAAHPGFGFRALFTFTTTVLVAFAFGSGPGLVAATLAALLIGIMPVASQSGLPAGPFGDLVITAVYLLAGAVITVLVSQERALRRYAEAAARVLEAANREREAFLSIAGHELRAPLTSVIGTLQLAQRQADVLEAAGSMQPEGRERLARLQSLHGQAIRASWQMNRLVADLLDTSRIQADRFELRPDYVDLGAIVADVVRDRRLAAPDRAIELRHADGAEYGVDADADRIAQVLTNFLTNADRYSPPGTPITVDLGIANASLRVAVTDDGPGISAADQERIWEPYTRGAQTSGARPPDAGLGMGLFISRAIVERHGGRIGVERAPGRGATFWFTLPRASGSRGPLQADTDVSLATARAPDAGLSIR